MGLLHSINSTKILLAGQSYWKVLFTSGKTLSELDTKLDTKLAIVRELDFQAMGGRFPQVPAFDPTKNMTTRKVEWLEDVVASGDAAHIKELILCTPQGDAHLPVVEPYSAFQFKRGTISMFGGERLLQAQVIGVVTDKETGECTASIWDVNEQKLYEDFQTTLFNFGSWREGAIAPGALNYEMMGIRLG